MTNEPDTTLTPEEQAAFAALPKSRQPTRLMEERTVAALAERNLLRGGRRRPRLRISVLAAGVAAAAALFVGGIAVGQWLGSRAVANSMAVAQHESALEMASAVQSAGSAYVTALAALARLADSSANGAAVAQGREAALTALYAAAYKLAQLAPDDPIAVTIRDRLESLQHEQGSDDDQGVIRHVVWF